MTYNFHSYCKHMDLSFKSVCNKEHKGVICNMTSSSSSFQSTRPVGRITCPFLISLVITSGRVEFLSPAGQSLNYRKCLVLLTYCVKAPTKSFWPCRLLSFMHPFNNFILISLTTKNPSLFKMSFTVLWKTTHLLQMSPDMWFPTMWQFDKCRLRPACAVPF